MELRDDLIKASTMPTQSAGKQGSVSVETPKWKKSFLRCPEHEDEEAKIYCEGCQRIGCVKCLYQHHQGHAHHLITDVFEEHKSELEGYLKPIRKHRGLLEEAIEPVNIRIKEVENRRSDVKKDIDFVFSEVFSELDARKSQLLQEVDRIADNKIEGLSRQKESTASTLDIVVSCLECVEGTLKLASPPEIMLMKLNMIDRVKQVADQLRSPALLAPYEGANIKFAYTAEELIDTLKDFGKVYTYDACAKKCTVSRDVEAAVVGERSYAILQAINAQDAPSVEPVESLECLLVSEITGIEVRGCWESQSQSLTSMYSLTYIPAEKGLHRLSVKVEGEHVRGSPFPISVTSLERPSEPIATIHDLKHPLGVDFSEQGRIIVSESDNNCVRLFAPNGNKICTIGCEGVKEGQLVDPRGVLADRDGDVLVVDTGNSRLQRFSSEGRFLQALSGFNTPVAVAWNPTNTCYYVTDYQRHCVWKVTSDLRDMQTFSEHGSGRNQLTNPVGVVCDGAGLVYVADSGNHRIQVFSPEGACLHRFGKEGTSEGCLKTPYGVAWHDGQIYVSERGSGRVSVFCAAEGRFLYYVDGRGTLLQKPGGVAVDSSGVVLVCNTGGDCLCMF